MDKIFNLISENNSYDIKYYIKISYEDKICFNDNDTYDILEYIYNSIIEYYNNIFDIIIIDYNNISVLFVYKNKQIKISYIKLFNNYKYWTLCIYYIK